MEHNCQLTAYYTGKQQPCLHTVHDLINAWGVYLILGVQVGVFNRQEVFILVTVTKLMCFWQKYQKSLKNTRISSLSTDTSRPSRSPYRSFKSQQFDVRILAQGYCVAIVSLSLLINLTLTKINIIYYYILRKIWEKLFDIQYL